MKLGVKTRMLNGSSGLNGLDIIDPCAAMCTCLLCHSAWRLHLQHQWSVESLPEFNVLHPKGGVQEALEKGDLPLTE